MRNVTPEDVKWNGTSAQIRGFPAIHTGRWGWEDMEECLAGRWGEVWDVGDDTSRIWCTGRGLVRLRRMNLPFPIPGPRGYDEEATFSFPTSYLKDVLRAIAYSSRRPTQLKYVNSRGSKSE